MVLALVPSTLAHCSALVQSSTSPSALGAPQLPAITQGMLEWHVSPVSSTFTWFISFQVLNGIFHSFLSFSHKNLLLPYYFVYALDETIPVPPWKYVFQPSPLMLLVCNLSGHPWGQRWPHFMGLDWMKTDAP